MFSPAYITYLHMVSLVLVYIIYILHICICQFRSRAPIEARTGIEARGKSRDSLIEAGFESMICIIYMLVRDGWGCYFALNHDVTLPFLTIHHVCTCAVHFGGFSNATS